MNSTTLHINFFDTLQYFLANIRKLQQDSYGTFQPHKDDFDLFLPQDILTVIQSTVNERSGASVKDYLRKYCPLVHVKLVPGASTPMVGSTKFSQDHSYQFRVLEPLPILITGCDH